MDDIIRRITEAHVKYVDDAIVVGFKPRGFVSESGAASFPDALREVLGIDALYPVHRLDKDTSGLIVYARTAKAAAELSNSIQQGSFYKAYRALLHGIPEPAEGTLTDFLFKDSRTGKVYTVKKERRGVRKAVLRYKLLNTFADPAAGEEQVSLVRIVTETGRTHQIRVQFGSRRLPLLGDRRYGAGDDYPPVALCATELSFPHPLTGATLSFEIPFDYPAFNVLA